MLEIIPKGLRCLGQLQVFNKTGKVVSLIMFYEQDFIIIGIEKPALECLKKIKEILK